MNLNQEFKLFSRLLYKNKNQFKHFIQYRKLEHVHRIYKKYLLDPKDELLLLGIKILMQAYAWLRLLCKQTYFMPFTLSMMSICSRLMYYSKEMIDKEYLCNIHMPISFKDSTVIEQYPDIIKPIEQYPDIIKPIEQYPDIIKPIQEYPKQTADHPVKNEHSVASPGNEYPKTTKPSESMETNLQDKLTSKPKTKKRKKETKKMDPALDFFGKRSEIDDIFGDF
ncbi:hypothetical protein HK103_005313 [Boothiomyces macroporosus]|uniref:Nucleolus and neural progenitor protein-like N-terminal domain-containing protein n=1 Tax=Boothiomyces macroporosus TaxID=261099 RepID=A0AAD5Y7V9_9FUNG|nr:hypothetical protein HK103_005313 [Boothiomyces macroporosus]